ncbi:prolyl 4-hydroxylase subunit alpha-1 isoform X1 [Falco naumanni]|uniref:prolyl 4-hydroxylase subunit alpha-1 isoform X2 n=1 Tax=Falco rusticolus TaxID=120794 RepID=UPI000FFBB580|nr:prolyl 4-hydroxylase subunit alpha-1 isoform X2 [Falco rusticolus]XP_040461946.1 prolyl 4-hydroxylase subunit alpha-1 isoform X1 [Falco naumanni]XP_055657205.1 prolyl 4-hydroxylase subunit alpha-1 isoform X1 [Falco peregrinus]
MAFNKIWYTVALGLLLPFSYAHTDFFTSIGHMTDLINTEKDLVVSLKDYIKAEESKLEQIKKWAEKLDQLTDTATKDPEGFLGHPVNAFKLMKRLNTEWGELESLVLKDMSDGFISNMTIQRQFFPNDEDQTGAAKALLRLQDTYNLDTDTLSRGNLPGVKHKSFLTAEDCFELGKIAYTEADYYHTELWMEQALKQLDEGEVSSADKVYILDYLSYAVYQQGDLGKAMMLTKRLLELDPEHQRANGNMKYFEYIMAKEKEANKSSTDSEDQMDKDTEVKKKDYLPERRKYEMLCRGEGLKMTPRRQKRLFCRYYDGNRNPRYILGPVKQEDEWDKPRIVRFLDIISDEEIETVKELAKPRLSRATVHDPETGKLTTAHYRVSKSAWLSGYESPVVSRINTRIQDLTGLDVSTAEELQVANYGVGGQYEPHFDFGRVSPVSCFHLFLLHKHCVSLFQVANYGVGGQYEPHFDFARKDEPDAFKELGTGNRIATWLFYMSDVSAGGATVFPEVGASVWPKKGTAVFWYNLFPSGEGDYSTRHAACPVLVGNKWVSNKWLHERGQEFRRPCTLSELE